MRAGELSVHVSCDRVCYPLCTLHSAPLAGHVPLSRNAFRSLLTFRVASEGLSPFSVVLVVICGTFVLHIQCEDLLTQEEFPIFHPPSAFTGNFSSPCCQRLLVLLQASWLLHPSLLFL